MNIDDVKTLYEYNYWANDQIFRSAQKVTKEQFEATESFPHGGLSGTLRHILNAETAWRARFEGNTVTRLDEKLYSTLLGVAIVCSCSSKWRQGRLVPSSILS